MFFITEELKKAFPKPLTVLLSDKDSYSVSTSIVQKRKYTTPYLDIIDELITEEFYTNDQFQKKESLVDEIMIRMKKKGIRDSRSIAEKMATILRPIDKQKGGAYPLKTKNGWII